MITGGGLIFELCANIEKYKRFLILIYKYQWFIVKNPAYFTQNKTTFITLLPYAINAFYITFFDLLLLANIKLIFFR